MPARVGAETDELQRRVAGPYTRMFERALLRMALSERGFECREVIRLQ